VVHHQLHALGVGIVVESLDVEVGIRGEEVEDVFLHVACPVFPSDVPALDEHGVETVVGGEVDVSAHVGVVGRVASRGRGLAVIGHSELDRGKLVGVGPVALTRDHLPPHTDVFGGMYPAGVGELAGLVEVEDEVGGQYLACVVGHHDGAPGALAGRLQPAFHALCVGGEPGAEGHGFVVEVEVHGRIVDQGCLVEVEVEAVVGLEHQRGLHTGVREDGLRHVARHSFL